MLILLAFVIEFPVTVSIPLFAEQAPEARGTVFAFMTIGSTQGFGFAPPVPTISSLITFFLVLKFLYDRPDLE